VSGRPGAEGAVGWLLCEVEVNLDGAVLVVEAAWFEGGAMRSDCDGFSVSWMGGGQRVGRGAYHDYALDVGPRKRVD